MQKKEGKSMRRKPPKPQKPQKRKIKDKNLKEIIKNPEKKLTFNTSLASRSPVCVNLKVIYNKKFNIEEITRQIEIAHRRILKLLFASVYEQPQQRTLPRHCLYQYLDNSSSTVFNLLENAVAFTALARGNFAQIDKISTESEPDVSRLYAALLNIQDCCAHFFKNNQTNNYDFDDFQEYKKATLYFTRFEKVILDIGKKNLNEDKNRNFVLISEEGLRSRLENCLQLLEKHLIPNIILVGLLVNDMLCQASPSDEKNENVILEAGNSVNDVLVILKKTRENSARFRGNEGAIVYQEATYAILLKEAYDKPFMFMVHMLDLYRTDKTLFFGVLENAWLEEKDRSALPFAFLADAHKALALSPFTSSDEINLMLTKVKERFEKKALTDNPPFELTVAQKGFLQSLRNIKAAKNKLLYRQPGGLSAKEPLWFALYKPSRDMLAQFEVKELAAILLASMELFHAIPNSDLEDKPDPLKNLLCYFFHFYAPPQLGEQKKLPIRVDDDDTTFVMNLINIPIKDPKEKNEKRKEILLNAFDCLCNYNTSLDLKEEKWLPALAKKDNFKVKFNSDRFIAVVDAQLPVADLFAVALSLLPASVQKELLKNSVEAFNLKQASCDKQPVNIANILRPYFLKYFPELNVFLGEGIREDHLLAVLSKDYPKLKEEKITGAKLLGLTFNCLFKYSAQQSEDKVALLGTHDFSSLEFKKITLEVFTQTIPFQQQRQILKRIGNRPDAVAQNYCLPIDRENKLVLSKIKLIEEKLNDDEVKIPQENKLLMGVDIIKEGSNVSLLPGFDEYKNDEAVEQEEYEKKQQPIFHNREKTFLIEPLDKKHNVEDISEQFLAIQCLEEDEEDEVDEDEDEDDFILYSEDEKELPASKLPDQNTLLGRGELSQNPVEKLNYVKIKKNFSAYYNEVEQKIQKISKNPREGRIILLKDSVQDINQGLKTPSEVELSILQSEVEILKIKDIIISLSQQLIRLRPVGDECFKEIRIEYEYTIEGLSNKVDIVRRLIETGPTADIAKKVEGLKQECIKWVTKIDDLQIFAQSWIKAQLRNDAMDDSKSYYSSLTSTTETPDSLVYVQAPSNDELKKLGGSTAESLTDLNEELADIFAPCKLSSSLPKETAISPFTFYSDFSLRTLEAEKKKSEEKTLFHEPQSESSRQTDLLTRVKQCQDSINAIQIEFKYIQVDPNTQAFNKLFLQNSNLEFEIKNQRKISKSLLESLTKENFDNSIITNSVKELEENVAIIDNIVTQKIPRLLKLQQQISIIESELALIPDIRWQLMRLSENQFRDAVSNIEDKIANFFTKKNKAEKYPIQTKEENYSINDLTKRLNVIEQEVAEIEGNLKKIKKASFSETKTASFVSTSMSSSSLFPPSHEFKKNLGYPGISSRSSSGQSEGSLTAPKPFYLALEGLKENLNKTEKSDRLKFLIGVFKAQGIALLTSLYQNTEENSQQAAYKRIQLKSQSLESKDKQLKQLEVTFTLLCRDLTFGCSEQNLIERLTDIVMDDLTGSLFTMITKKLKDYDKEIKSDEFSKHREWVQDFLRAYFASSPAQALGFDDAQTLIKAVLSPLTWSQANSAIEEFTQQLNNQSHQRLILQQRRAKKTSSQAKINSFPKYDSFTTSVMLGQLKIQADLQQMMSHFNENLTQSQFSLPQALYEMMNNRPVWEHTVEAIKHNTVKAWLGGLPRNRTVRTLQSILEKCVEYSSKYKDVIKHEDFNVALIINGILSYYQQAQDNKEISPLTASNEITLAFKSIFNRVNNAPGKKDNEMQIISKVVMMWRAAFKKEDENLNKINKKQAWQCLHDAGIDPVWLENVTIDNNLAAEKDVELRSLVLMVNPKICEYVLTKENKNQSRSLSVMSVVIRTAFPEASSDAINEFINRFIELEKFAIKQEEEFFVSCQEINDEFKGVKSAPKDPHLQLKQGGDYEKGLATIALLILTGLISGTPHEKIEGFKKDAEKAQFKLIAAFLNLIEPPDQPEELLGCTNFWHFCDFDSEFVENEKGSELRELTSPQLRTLAKVCVIEEVIRLLNLLLSDKNEKNLEYWENIFIECPTVRKLMIGESGFYKELSQRLKTKGKNPCLSVEDSLLNTKKGKVETYTRESILKKLKKSADTDLPVELFSFSSPFDLGSEHFSSYYNDFPNTESTPLLKDEHKPITLHDNKHEIVREDKYQLDTHEHKNEYEGKHKRVTVAATQDLPTQVENKVPKSRRNLTQPSDESFRNLIVDLMVHTTDNDKTPDKKNKEVLHAILKKFNSEVEALLYVAAKNLMPALMAGKLAWLQEENAQFYSKLTHIKKDIHEQTLISLALTENKQTKRVKNYLKKHRLNLDDYPVLKEWGILSSDDKWVEDIKYQDSTTTSSISKKMGDLAFAISSAADQWSDKIRKRITRIKEDGSWKTEVIKIENNRNLQQNIKNKIEENFTKTQSGSSSDSDLIRMPSIVEEKKDFYSTLPVSSKIEELSSSPLISSLSSDMDESNQGDSSALSSNFSPFQGSSASSYLTSSSPGILSSSPPSSLTASSTDATKLHPLYRDLQIILSVNNNARLIEIAVLAVQGFKSVEVKSLKSIDQSDRFRKDGSILSFETINQQERKNRYMLVKTTLQKCLNSIDQPGAIDLLTRIIFNFYEILMQEKNINVELSESRNQLHIPSSASVRSQSFYRAQTSSVTHSFPSVDLKSNSKSTQNKRSNETNQISELNKTTVADLKKTKNTNPVRDIPPGGLMVALREIHKEAENLGLKQESEFIFKLLLIWVQIRVMNLVPLLQRNWMEIVNNDYSKKKLGLKLVIKGGRSLKSNELIKREILKENDSLRYSIKLLEDPVLSPEINQFLEELMGLGFIDNDTTVIVQQVCVKYAEDDDYFRLWRVAMSKLFLAVNNVSKPEIDFSLKWTQNFYHYATDALLRIIFKKLFSERLKSLCSDEKNLLQQAQEAGQGKTRSNIKMSGIGKLQQRIGAQKIFRELIFAVRNMLTRANKNTLFTASQVARGLIENFISLNLLNMMQYVSFIHHTLNADNFYELLEIINLFLMAICVGLELAYQENGTGEKMFWQNMIKEVGARLSMGEILQSIFNYYQEADLSEKQVIDTWLPRYLANMSNFFSSEIIGRLFDIEKQTQSMYCVFFARQLQQASFSDALMTPVNMVAGENNYGELRRTFLIQEKAKNFINPIYEEKFYDSTQDFIKKKSKKSDLEKDEKIDIQEAAEIEARHIENVMRPRGLHAELGSPLGFLCHYLLRMSELTITIFNDGLTQNKIAKEFIPSVTDIMDCAFQLIQGQLSIKWLSLVDSIDFNHLERIESKAQSSTKLKLTPKMGYTILQRLLKIAHSAMRVHAGLSESKKTLVEEKEKKLIELGKLIAIAQTPGRDKLCLTGFSQLASTDSFASTIFNCMSQRMVGKQQSDSSILKQVKNFSAAFINLFRSDSADLKMAIQLLFYWLDNELGVKNYNFKQLPSDKRNLVYQICHAFFDGLGWFNPRKKLSMLEQIAPFWNNFFGEAFHQRYLYIFRVLLIVSDKLDPIQNKKSEILHGLPGFDHENNKSKVPSKSGIRLFSASSTSSSSSSPSSFTSVFNRRNG